MNQELLKKYEPKLYRLFLNSKKQNRISSAYLLYGEKNAPLKEIAMYLSQSLNCENDIFACNECTSCKRFISGVRPDFYLIDGQNDMIKKGDIQALEQKFSLSAIEKSHTLSYVINRVDNINNEAANALLKFLEEPKVGQIAFLTTYNPNKVLKTILSRSISIKINPIKVDEFLEELNTTELIFQEEGKKKEQKVHLTATQAYILSKNFSSIDEIKDQLKTEPHLLEGINSGEIFLNEYCINYNQACFTLLRETTLLKDNKCYNWMYLTILDVFESILLKLDDDKNPFNDVIKKLQPHSIEIQRGVETIKEILNHKNLNYNATLIAARILSALKEEN